LTLRRGARAATLFVLSLPFLPACSRTPRITQTGCDAPAEVEAARAKLEDPSADCWYRLHCWRERIERARALRQRYPQSLAAHRYLAILAYRIPSDLAKALPTRAELQEEYDQLSRRRPGDPSYPYLVALLSINEKERSANLRRALALDPHFVWAHHSLTRHLTRWRPAAEEKAEARRRIDTFAAACPTRVSEILELVGRLEDRDAWSTHSKRLVAAITPESGNHSHLPALWEQQFKFTPPEKHPELRERLRQQVQALRRDNRPKDIGWLRALREGYKMLGEDSEGRKVEDLWLSNFPGSRESCRIRLERFWKDHPRPGEKDEAATQAWLSKEISETDRLLENCPEDELVWQVRLQALRQWTEATPDMVETAVQRVLALLGDRIAGQAADVYIEKKIRLGEAARLVETDRRVIEEDWKENLTRGLEGEALKSTREVYRMETSDNRSRFARLELARTDAPAALRVLRQIDQDLIAWQKDFPPDLHKYRRARYWNLFAQAAELEGRQSEALEAYRRSLELYPDDQKVREAARAAFRKARGDEAGFIVWLEATERAAQTAGAEQTLATRRPLPEFRLSDLAGRQWTPKDLRGKPLLVNFWATWCGPCRQELPWVEKLHRRSDREGTARVVTISVDDNPGLIEPFLKAAKYGFPVLVGGPGSVEKFVPRGIPQTWIVNPEGVIVQEQLGFAGEGEKWLSRMEAALDEAKRGGATKGSGS
jgi:thiol-disulfide isomerase/thioredoxin